MESENARRCPSLVERRVALGIFLLTLAFHFWGVSVGWRSKNLPGVEFRQAQTALSAHWILEENDFSPAYPTPVLGRPWSIPMEFPLYQWTTVIVSKVTNWSLTKAGRAVSIACFYLCLPAIFLLLDRWRVAVGWRWLVLAVVATCPFYIFYARAFLIETMALMFSLWFWVAFERAVAGRSSTWLIVAMLTGAGAGLVKVTTFMLYLVPTGVWAAMRLWASRREGWTREAAWMFAAVTLPFAATLWWLDFADATKALNPLAAFIESGNLRDFNFGTTATRFGAAMWQMKLRIIAEELTWLPLLGLAAVMVGLARGARWREIGACLGCFALVLVVFPVLYALHDYYYVANAVLLLIALGLAVVAFAEASRVRWAVWALFAVMLAGQIWRYVDHYYPTQSRISEGGSGLTMALRALTEPDEVIVILGEDWSSITPYYARRKALMLRDDVARDREKVEQALARLDGQKIGALLIVGEADGREWLIDRASIRGLAREPLCHWRDVAVYLPVERQTRSMHTLLDNNYHEVRLAPGVHVPREHLAGKWCDVAPLRRWERQPFSEMKPEPVRFFSSFGPNMDGSGGQYRYGAHPVTRLVFALPAGPHTLRTSLQMSPDAYRQDLADSEATDGVEVALAVLEPDGTRRVVDSRIFNPRKQREDRGNQRPLEISFALAQAGEVELFFGPGPSGRDTKDWIVLGPVRFD